MANVDLFRESALKNITSPDQLDRLMQVTRPRGWIAVSALAAILLVALGWGFYGSIPTRVGGSGILLDATGGILDVQARAGGRLLAVLVRPGDRVEAGQILARIDQRDIALSLSQAQVFATELRGQRDQTASYYEKYLREQEQNLRTQARDLRQQARDAARNYQAQRAAIETRSRDGAERLRALQELLKAEQELQQQGYISKLQVQEMQERVEAARESVSKARADLEQLDTSTRESIAKVQTDSRQLDIKLLELQNQRTQALDTYALKLVEAEQKVRQLGQDLDAAGVVTAPVAGVVTELMAAPETFVAERTSIVKLQTGGQGLRGVIYVSAGTGKEIKVGTRVEVTPATVKKEEWGSIVGKVRNVGELPATASGMMAVLADQELVRTFSASGPQLTVSVELDRDPKAPSGYHWTSKRGPEIKLTSGTLATAQIVVREQPPITLVLPFLKKFFGLS